MGSAISNRTNRKEVPPVSTQDSAPVLWHTPRVIDGHPGYTWHYQDQGSDLRVVTRRENEPTPRSTVVGSVRVARTADSEIFTAYDADGTRLGAGPSGECAALVAETDTARQAAPERCEANARRGTGTGICDLPLNTNGYCDRPGDHLD